MLLDDDFTRKVSSAKVSRLSHWQVKHAVFCNSKNIHGQFKTNHLRSLRLNGRIYLLNFCLNNAVLKNVKMASDQSKVQTPGKTRKC